MKLGIIGSREFCNQQFVIDKVTEYLEGSFCEVISGGARGVDTWAELTSKDLNVYTCIIKPEWDKFGKKAGIIRNKVIVERSDKLLVFWDGYSKGTKSTIDFAVESKKPIDIYIRN